AGLVRGTGFDPAKRVTLKGRGVADLSAAEEPRRKESDKSPKLATASGKRPLRAIVVSSESIDLYASYFVARPLHRSEHENLAHCRARCRSVHVAGGPRGGPARPSLHDVAIPDGRP